MKIERLKIFTSNLEDQIHFYEKVLGLEIQDKKEGSFILQLGYSVLEFQQEQDATPYHIAFHIPGMKEEEALVWLKQRVSILKNGDDEIVDFPSWNAKSLYFYDADKNVLEFISRKHFPTETKDFDAESIVGIAEIGLATKNVREAYDFLHSNFSLKKFTGDFNVFCATGDENGLFIVIDKEKKDWFPSDDKAFASNFEMNFSAAGQKAALTYKDEILQLL